MIVRDFSSQLRTALNSGKTLDEALLDLRASGASMVESIKATHFALGWNLSEAKHTVHFSDAWADVREQHEDFHQELEAFAGDEA